VGRVVVVLVCDWCLWVVSSWCWCVTGVCRSCRRGAGVWL